MKTSKLTGRFNPAAAARQGIAGLQPYIPGKPIVEVKEELGLDEVVKLASNECALPLPESIVQNIIDEATDFGRYPDGHCRRLRRELSAWLDVDPNCLAFGNGAEECIRLVAQVFIDQGDVCILPDPIFDAYATATILCGGEVDRVPLKNYCIDLEAILKRVSDRTKLVWLCSPANPTGPVIRKNDFDSFLSRLPERIVVVLDEAYREFVTNEESAHADHYLFKDDRVIGLRTFSKAFGMAGLRVGYVVAHPMIIELISKVKLPFNVNVPAQAAALALLREQEFVQNYIDLVVSERAQTGLDLETLGLKVLPSQANFLFIELPTDGDRVFRKLLQKGFIIRPGSVFGLPNFMRVSLGTRVQNQQFVEHLRRILLEI